MPGGWAGGSGQIPLDDRELLICALNHKPMDRISTEGLANLASELLQTRHAFSVERWLDKPSIAVSPLEQSRTCRYGFPPIDLLFPWL